MQSLLPGGLENRIQNETINNKVRVGGIIISQILKLVNRGKKTREYGLLSEETYKRKHRINEN